MDSNRYIKPKIWWAHVGSHVFTFSGRPVWQEKDMFQWVSCGVSCRCSAIVSMVFSCFPLFAMECSVFVWLDFNMSDHTSWAECPKMAKWSGLKELKLWSYKRHHCTAFCFNVFSQFCIKCRICPKTTKLPGGHWQWGARKHDKLVMCQEGTEAFFPLLNPCISFSLSLARPLFSDLQSKWRWWHNGIGRSAWEGSKQARHSAQCSSA